MKPRIENHSEILLVGKRIRMSLINIQTKELWQGFMPQRNDISNKIGTDYYSVEIYPNLEYFKQFNPKTEFEKWAAVRVSSFNSVPAGMECLTVSGGLYAIFKYKGTAADAPKTYQYIYSEWIQRSDFQLDHRPHFTLMGEKYKNNDPNSEEEFWIPIIKN